MPLIIIRLLLMRKRKVFVILLIIGLCCVLIAPSFVCDPHDTSCAAIIYAGYGALGICGLIFLYQALLVLKEICKCLLECCQFCRRCLLPRRRLRQSYSDRLLDDGELQSDNYEVQDLPEDEFPPPFFEQEESVYHDIEEEWEQDFRSTFHQQECTICLDALIDEDAEKVSDVVLRKRCGHKFHRACIEDWLQKNDSCPICRKVIA